MRHTSNILAVLLLSLSFTTYAGTKDTKSPSNSLTHCPWDQIGCSNPPPQASKLKLNSKKTHIKTVAKPVGSFTSKQKPAKPALKMLKQQSVKTKAVSNTFGTGLGRADLIIRPFYQNGSLPEGFPGQSYCEHAIEGGTPKNIWFFITNQGNASAKASQMKIFFNTFVGSGAASTYDRKIKALAKGQSVTIKVPLPKGCYPNNFSSSCHFRIVADTAYQVQESSESNNHIDSKCVSPAG